MKLVFMLGLIIFSLQALAQGQNIASRFHLLKTKCESVSEDLPEVTPQSPPLDVDDPATPGCNQWEINVLTNGDFTRGERHLELPLLDINYGIGDNLQLKYEVPMEKTQTGEVSSTEVGRSKVGVKYMFYENEETDTEIGFYPQVEIATPQEDVGGNVVSLPLLLATKLGAIKTGEVMMTTNLGYNISSRADTENSVFVATGLGVPVLRNLSLMGEVSAEEALTKNTEDVREELVKVNVGMVATVSKHFFLFGSLGESIISSDHLNHTYALAGVRILTGGRGF
jgi:hypothetical protein